MPNGLKIDDLLRAERTREQMAEGSEISAKSTQPIDVRFRRETTHQVFQAGANNELEDVGPGKGSLSRKIDRVGDLHVSHAQSGAASDLGAEVHSAGIRDVHNRPEGRQLTGEIPILVPSVERKGFVEAKIVFADGSQAEAHITAVSEVDRSDPLLALGGCTAGYD